MAIKTRWTHPDTFSIDAVTPGFGVSSLINFIRDTPPSMKPVTDKYEQYLCAWSHEAGGATGPSCCLMFIARPSNWDPAERDPARAVTVVATGKLNGIRGNWYLHRYHGSTFRPAYVL